MKRITIIALIVLLIAGLFVACDQDKIVDDELNKGVKITFNANGGTGTMDPITVKNGETTKLPANTFTYEGNEFAWWDTEPDGSGHSYGDKANITPTSDMVLYAQWMEVEDITSSTTILTPGKAYRTVGASTTISSARVTIGEGSEAVIIILSENTTLNVEKGINVGENQKLLIKGSGKLVVTGSANNAGIGSDDGHDSGVITIEDGDITVTGGENAAGIGGGRGGNGGIINLDGGVINVTGGTGGAGIGGGSGKGVETIVIGGGQITSTGGDNGGAGIGGGKDGTPTTIIISGGTIQSTGKGNGAGIGGGENGGTGTIKIGKTDEGSPVVTAIGGDGAGNPRGIGKGAGEGEEKDIILLGGMGIKCSPSETGDWEPYDGSNPKKYMKTFSDGVIIEFNANGGEGTMVAQAVPMGEATKLAANKFTKEGKSFAGWATTSTGSKVYDDRQEVTISEGITLYATWGEEVAILITSTTTFFEGGKTYYTGPGTTTITDRLSIDGEGPVTIRVTKDTTLDTKGISVAEGQTLKIETEDGSVLKADASSLNYKIAGIGGNELFPTCGTIEIYGTGTVTAKGGKLRSSGIGGVKGGSAGTIKIYGGTINATGGNDGGAGIGGNGGSILIEGGENNITVVATAGNAGSGIGGSEVNESAGTIEIKKTGAGSVTVTANGGYYGAGIGGSGNSGGSGGGIGGSGGTITISGGTVEATGKYGGAGIGGGSCGGAGGTISISGGTVTATGDKFGPPSSLTTEGGAGIGGGYKGNSGTISITGGSVTANSVASSTHGIGKGYGGTEETDITLGDKVLLLVSTDEIHWTPYTTTRERYMNTTEPKYITAETTTIQSGYTWTIQGDVENPNRIAIEGTEDTTIILPAGLKLTVEKGIHVSTDQTLIIDGAGELVSGNKLSGEEYVSSEQYLSGIGDNCDGYRDCVGTIIINGGIINATAGYYASGIEAGVCEINGGEINAKGGKCGEGIGSYGASITINGGTVIAIGGSGGSGAGIGGKLAEITITGGNITATGKTDEYGEGAAGIGGGSSNFKKITISGGEVTATGGAGAAGIGSADVLYDHEQVDGTIIISGGIVTAQGGKKAAGIGGGYTSNGGNITISGGTVVAEGGNDTDVDGYDCGAGIGGGARGNGGTITISGGNITATGGDVEGLAGGAGIGGGTRCYDDGGNSGTLTMTGGTIIANGGTNAFGIGRGSSYSSEVDSKNQTLGIGEAADEGHSRIKSGWALQYKTTSGADYSSQPGFVDVSSEPAPGCFARYMKVEAP